MKGPSNISEADPSYFESSLEAATRQRRPEKGQALPKQNTTEQKTQAISTSSTESSAELRRSTPATDGITLILTRR